MSIRSTVTAHIVPELCDLLTSTWGVHVCIEVYIYIGLEEYRSTHNLNFSRYIETYIGKQISIFSYPPVLNNPISQDDDGRIKQEVK